MTIQRRTDLRFDSKTNPRACQVTHPSRATEVLGSFGDRAPLKGDMVYPVTIYCGAPCTPKKKHAQIIAILVAGTRWDSNTFQPSPVMGVVYDWVYHVRQYRGTCLDPFEKRFSWPQTMKKWGAY